MKRQPRVRVGRGYKARERVEFTADATTGEAGSFARFRSWLSWRSLRVAARGFCECPRTLFV